MELAEGGKKKTNEKITENAMIQVTNVLITN